MDLNIIKKSIGITPISSMNSWMKIVVLYNFPRRARRGNLANPQVASNVLKKNDETLADLRLLQIYPEVFSLLQR